jgi:Flp pilus assembly CpaF family ATPase
MTLLNVLSSFIPDGERIVTIEDAVELQLQQDHVVRLESRPPNIEGRGAITIRDLTTYLERGTAATRGCVRRPSGAIPAGR